MKTLFTLLFILVVSGMIKAQTTGHISYDLDFASDHPDMATMLPMMAGSTLQLYFAPDQSKVDMVMGGFMKMQTVANSKMGKGLMLMEIMGNKFATEFNVSDSQNQKESPKSKVEITSETKQIIGYTCTKVIVRDEMGTEVIMWVAKDLIASLKGQKQFGSAEINGIPLEFTTVNNGMTIHFIATKFNQNVNANTFNMEIPQGYKIVTEEELKNMSGGF